MTLAVPNLLMWIASAIAAGWKTSQIIRAPRDRGLRVVTACTLLVFVALSAQLAVSVHAFAALFPVNSPKLIQNVLLTCFFALLIVLLQSSTDPSALRSNGFREVVLAVLASLGLVVAFTAANPTSRGASYDTTAASSVLLFYLIGNLYLAYATARGAYLAWHAADHTQSQARLSLRLAAAGLVVCCCGTHLPRVLATSGQLAIGWDIIPGTGTWTTPLLAAGISVLFLGIGYPGARTAIIKMRLWLQEHRHYRQLQPLWTTVYKQFPTIALFPPTSSFGDLMRIRHMRLRYYRRIIECRDGLVCLNPYTDQPDGATTTGQQAALVHQAVTRKAAGREPVADASVIAAPTLAGMDADLSQLFALSQALDRIAKNQNAS